MEWEFSVFGCVYFRLTYESIWRMEAGMYGADPCLPLPREWIQREFKKITRAGHFVSHARRARHRTLRHAHARQWFPWCIKIWPHSYNIRMMSLEIACACGWIFPCTKILLTILCYYLLNLLPFNRRSCPPASSANPWIGAIPGLC